MIDDLHLRLCDVESLLGIQKSVCSVPTTKKRIFKVTNGWQKRPTKNIGTSTKVGRREFKVTNGWQNRPTKNIGTSTKVGTSKKPGFTVSNSIRPKRGFSRRNVNRNPYGKNTRDIYAKQKTRYNSGATWSI